MPTAVKLFVEDKTMQKFIIDFVQKKFGQILNAEKDFIRFGSWSEIGKEPQKFVQNTDKGGVNLVFADADNNFNERVTEVKGLLKLNR